MCAVVLAAGLALVLGILYRNFDGQMRDELVKEAAYLEYGVEHRAQIILKISRIRVPELHILLRMERCF